MSTDLLSAKESERLSELEVVIDRGLRGLQEAGAALMEIRDLRLYRATHKSFEAYMKERWERTRDWANKQIAAAKVNTVVSRSDRELPPVESERQARELAPLLSEPEKLEEAWEEASSNGEVTAEKVKEAVTKRLPEKPDDHDPQMLLDERPCPTCGRWTPQWVIARVEPPEGQRWRWLSIRGKALSRKARNQRRDERDAG